MKSLQRVTKILIIIGVGLIAASLRLWGVDNLSPDGDEIVYFNTGLHYAYAIRDGNWKELGWYEKNYEHPVLAKITYGVALSQMPRPPRSWAKNEGELTRPPYQALWLVTRLVSAALGVLAALALAVFNPLAGLLLAIHTFAIKYTAVTYLEALPGLTSLLAVLAYGRWCILTREKPFKWLAWDNLWLVVSAGMLGATAASKYIYSVAGIAIALHFLWRIFSEKRPKGRSLGMLLVWGLFSLGAFFILDPYLWHHTLRRLSNSVFFSLNYSQASDTVLYFNYPWWQPLLWLSLPVTSHNPEAIPFEPGDFIIAVDTIIATFALIGIPRLIKRNLVVALWLLTGLGFLLAWGTKWPQYAVTILVPLCLSAAEGFRWIVAEPLERLIIRRRKSETERQ